MDILYSALTSTGCSTLSAFITCWLYNRMKERETAERKRNEAELDRLRERRMSGLENDLKAHLAADNPAATQAEMSKLRGELQRIGDQLQRNQERWSEESQKINRALGEFTGVIDGIKTWLQNTNSTIQQHITGDMHHGKNG